VPQPRYHAVASLALSAVAVTATRRWRTAVPILVAGVLVDIDHLVDWGVNRAAGRADYIIVPLHAWELVLGLLWRRTTATGGLAAGLAVHLLMDQMFNVAVKHPLFYWLTVRAAYRFRAVEPLVHREVFQEKAVWMQRTPLDWI
jgi:hypothetical protein